MSLTLSARDKRALRLGAFILIPLALYFLVLTPLTRTITDQRERVAQERAGLENDQQLIHRASQFDINWAEESQWLSYETQRLFSGDDDIGATSALADYVTAQAKATGVKLRQTETRPSIPVTGSLYAVQLNVRLDGTTRAVLSFLGKLEGGSRLVKVGRLTFSPMTIAVNTSSPSPMRATPNRMSSASPVPMRMSGGGMGSMRTNAGRMSSSMRSSVVGGGGFSSSGSVSMGSSFRIDGNGGVTVVGTSDGFSVGPDGPIVVGTQSSPAIDPGGVIYGSGNSRMAAQVETRGLSVVAELYGYALLPPPQELLVSDAKPGAPYRVRGTASLPALRIADAIANDPFSPERGNVPPPVVVRERQPFPIQLVGTVVSDNDAFAVCRIGEAPVTNLRLGQQFAGYTVQEIQRGIVVFSDANGNTTRLTVPSPRI